MPNLNQILFNDFCPGLNRYVYWLKQPFGWIAFAAAAASLVAISISPVGWWILASCLAVVAIQLTWPSYQTRVCECELIFDRPRAIEGEEVPIKLKITNRSPIPIWGMAIEKGFIHNDSSNTDSGNQEDQDVNVTLASVPAYSTNTYEWKFTPQRRGLFPIEPPRISTGFPFGIWTSSKKVNVPKRLIVWPRTERHGHLPQSDASGSSDCGKFEDRAGDQGDILGSRLWRPGEPLRMVNWAQTAKSQEDLIVIERQSTTQRRAHLLLDPTPSANSQRNIEVGEWQIRIMASIAKELHQHRYSLQVSTGSTSKTIGSSFASLKMWFDELATLDLKELSSIQGMPRITGDAVTWLITASLEHARLVRRMPNVKPVLLVTEDTGPIDYTGRSFIVDIDRPGLSPFQQLYLNSGMSHGAKQAG